MSSPENSAPIENTASEGPGTDSPGVIIITLTAQAGNSDPVTGNTTLNFDVSLEDSSEPNLLISFYEVVPSSTTPNSLDYLPVTLDYRIATIWNNGVGTFSVPMTSYIFDQLTSPQTNFAVKAQIAADSNSLGLFTFGIDLSTP